MEDNNYQPQYNQPYNQPQYPQPQNDYPQYGQQLPEIDTPDFLPKAIATVVMSQFPVASIIAIVFGANNKRNIRDYLAMGGKMTPKVRVSHILSTVGLWLGVGATILYGFYLLYFGFIMSLGMGWLD
ncbi:MAG: hypothetical protein IKO89_00780 [Bacteroidales bacterium]|jgi:hypothetical protein|nr:hypothetical protein [Bacteroidales bacterium]